MKVKKVLNSSVVLVEHDTGADTIVLGKGIGYGKRPGDEVDESAIDSTFVPAPGAIGIFSDVPAEFVDLGLDIVRLARERLDVELNDNVYLTLADHLAFAVRRLQDGLVVSNRLAWEIRTFYPREFAIGQAGLELLNDRLGLTLPEEEAANIAFHIANAERSASSAFDAMRAAQLISDIVSIVSYGMNRPMSAADVHWSRFLTHLQFFVDRFYDGRMLEREEDFLYGQLQERYPDSITCAERIRTFISTRHGVNLPNEEVAYMALHIERLVSQE